MKKIVKISDKDHIEKYIDLVDGFILALKDFSIGFNCYFTVDEVIELCNKHNHKEIFLSINKNIFNSELNDLEKILLKLSKLDIKILFYDLSILYINKKNNLDLELVWNQTHMVTNYNTCNYYYKKGVDYGYVSSEITLDEIVEMNKNTEMKLLVEVLSHQVMSASRRKLLTNFYSSINKEYDKKEKKIKENDKEYLVSEDNNGTVIKTGSILNGICTIPVLLKENIPYIVLDEYDISYEKIIEVLGIIGNVVNGIEVDKNIEKSKELFGDDTSFFYKKTIYKVKGEK